MDIGSADPLHGMAAGAATAEGSCRERRHAVAPVVPVSDSPHTPYSRSARTIDSQSTSTLYVPIVSPPTPAPSPRLGFSAFWPDIPSLEGLLSRQAFAALSTTARRQYLSTLLSECSPSELLFVSTTISPLMRRDFLRELPPELALHILGFIEDPKTLLRASRVSTHWHNLLDDEWLWKRMCAAHHFQLEREVAAGKVPSTGETG